MAKEKGQDAMKFSFHFTIRNLLVRLILPAVSRTKYIPGPSLTVTGILMVGAPILPK